MNKPNNKMNNKGFTLIELLATIAVLSIIITIVIYFAMNIINNSKTKSYTVTINNIEKEVNNYVIESSKELDWMSNNNIEYQCITVQHLIDKGYFSNDVLNSYVNQNQKVKSTDYIYFERDKNSKTINKSILLYGDSDDILNLQNGYCKQIKASGKIDTDVISIGDVINGYCREKEITIKYSLYNVLNNSLDYNYYYSYDTDNNIKELNSFPSLFVEKKITVNKNGNLSMNIKYGEDNIVNSTLSVNKIDNVGPVITSTYSGNKKVKEFVKIPLNVTDIGSGVNLSSFNEDDLIVTIGDNDAEKVELEKVSVNKDGTEISYNLIITDEIHRGKVKILIEDGNVEDKLKNKNTRIELPVDIEFIKEYNVLYYLGNGTSTAKNIEIGKTTCVYGEDCKLQEFSEFGYEFPVSSGNSPDNHWSFYGWITENLKVSQKDYSKNDYNNGQKIKIIENLSNDTLYLYAIGRKQFRFYTGMNPISSKYIEVFQYWNPYSTDEAYLTSIKIPQQENINGWTFIGYKGGSNSANSNVDFVSSKVGNELKPAYDQARVMRSKYKRIVTIKFDANGGSGTMASLTGTQYYNSGCKNNSSVNTLMFNLPEVSFTYAGRTFSGWKSKTTGDVYSNKQTGVLYGPAVDGSPTMILEAQWKLSIYTVKYDANGGSGAPENQTKTYGKDLTLSSTMPRKSGYKFVGWKDSDGTSYSTNGIYKKNKSTTMIAQWESITFTIKYIANGGHGTMANTECIYGENCRIKENSFTYDNYTFVGWTTKSDGTDDGYGWTNFNSTWKFGDGNKGVVGNTLNLYARWRKNRAYVKFDTAGGTIKSSTTNNGVNYKWTTGDTGIISRQKESGTATNKFFYIEYGSKKDLPNWNSSTYIYITRTNYSAVSDKEWICESGCTTSNKTFDHTVDYSPSDFCDITNGDCTVAVGVNWKRNTTTKYVNAKSGLNCRKGPGTSYGINSSYNKSCRDAITGYNYNSSWFYVESTGCYYSNSYLQSSKSGISCGSSSSGGGTTSCSVSVNACGNYCNSTHPGTVVRTPGSTSCYCCPDDYYVADPTTNPNCRFGWSC